MRFARLPALFGTVTVVTASQPLLCLEFVWGEVSMAYLKSVLAGLAALMICALVLPTVAVLVPTVQYRPAVNPILLAAAWPMAWVVAAVSFTAGFYWEFRRASREHH